MSNIRCTRTPLGRAPAQHILMTRSLWNLLGHALQISARIASTQQDSSAQLSVSRGARMLSGRRPRCTQSRPGGIGGCAGPRHCNRLAKCEFPSTVGTLDCVRESTPKHRRLQLCELTTEVSLQVLQSSTRRLAPPRGCRRGVAQLVEHRSPKPRVGGSSPFAPASATEVHRQLLRPLFNSSGLQATRDWSTPICSPRHGSAKR